MIEYDSVTKIFGIGKKAVTATDNVTFTIADGETAVFLGPSGCGKTTLLRMTNRLEAVTRGTIRVMGRDTMEMDAQKLRLSMGYVIQQIGLFPNKTIAGNIAVVPRMLGWDRGEIRSRVDELLGMVNLDPEIYRDRYPAELSGGQQQRVGVARGLAANPDILLMDEPFGAIDPINRDQIQDEFLRLQGKLKKTIAFVSHDIHEAIKMADKIAIFKDGRLVQFDTPEAILMRPANKFVSDFVGADRALKVLGLLRIRDAMNPEPRNLVQAGEDAPGVLKMMEAQNLPLAFVIKDNRPVGYVHPKLLKYEQGRVGELAEKFPETLGAREPVRDALSAMLMHDITAFPVVDDNGNLAGTISYRQIQKSILDLYADDHEESKIE
ncbi:ABC transporter ATP-binding protein [Desulfatitalea alkaliphila]|uniref:ATP-binding cassette domain-containing protein n=1 Tax=Desulfatitalea alkaliphila TaxID=2929485 RepID=A0AA41UIL5_9BACT|nr:ABC transporter ATP-binding protein [Desulfatitalea alkaliphila]MCJ8499677.1 ATP-binding cassette domain-containing protein [Desulfatitalea alkaliphila]